MIRMAGTHSFPTSVQKDPERSISSLFIFTFLSFAMAYVSRILQNRKNHVVMPILPVFRFSVFFSSDIFFHKSDILVPVR